MSMKHGRSSPKRIPLSSPNPLILAQPLATDTAPSLAAERNQRFRTFSSILFFRRGRFFLIFCSRLFLFGGNELKASAEVVNMHRVRW